MDWTALINLAKQYGPTAAVLLVIIYWQWRHIDKLIERNASIYEKHIKNLSETQNWLLAKLIGPQPSSSESPTMEELKEAAKRPDNKAYSGEEKQ